VQYYSGIEHGDEVFSCPEGSGRKHSDITMQQNVRTDTRLENIQACYIRQKEDGIKGIQSIYFK
jgi:hypothetical protein